MLVLGEEEEAVALAADVRRLAVLHFLVCLENLQAIITLAQRVDQGLLVDSVEPAQVSERS